MERKGPVENGQGIFPLAPNVQDATRIVLDIEGGLCLVEASPQARPSGERVLLRTLSLDGQGFEEGFL